MFQGRHDILSKMRRFFTTNRGKQHIYVLYGLGGAGKTQIAYKFIKDSSSLFSDIFLIDASSSDKIYAGLKKIALMKKIGDSPEQALEWLTSKHEEWLLFFDNADNPDINLNQFLPQCDHGNMIITTQNHGLRSYGSNSPVSDLATADAVALLLESAQQKNSPRNQQIATEIVKVLGHHALAIVQAGVFTLKSTVFESYLDLYSKNRVELLSKKPAQSPDNHSWAVYTTWQMSFDRLQLPAAMFLQLCSFIHNEGISEQIFRDASMYSFPASGPSKEELQKPLELLSYFLGPSGEWESLRFLDITNDIRAYSLIDFDDDKKMFSIHPMVHAWSRTVVNNPELYQAAAESIIGMAISRIQKGNVLACLRLLPHVESFQLVATEGVANFGAQYGRIFFEAGNYEKAEKLQFTVLEQRKLLGDGHPDTLPAMEDLALTYSMLQKFRKAEDLEVAVLEKRKQLLGDTHPDTLCALSALASTYLNLQDFKKAEELEVVVLEKRKQFLGTNHLDTLYSMGRLAVTYSCLQELKKARDMGVAVWEKRKQLIYDNHPDTLVVMANLGQTLSVLKEFKKAAEFQVAVLRKREQLLGENHPGTLRAMGNLASTYRQSAELNKAEELEVVVLQRRKKFLGENHPDTLITMGNLASTYSKLGTFKKAEELAIIVLEKRKQFNGDNHPDTLLAVKNLANFRRLRKVKEAEELKKLVEQKAN